MKIDLSRLNPEGELFSGSEPASAMDLEGDVQVAETHPIQYELKVELVGNELLVRGELHTEVTFRCSRCNEPMAVHIRDDRFFTAHEVSDSVEYVDLTPEIRESMILAFPSQPVCSPGCKGLCATCGQNLNEGACECQPPSDDRWDALDGLKMI